jgi:hypothetical protein
MLLAHPGFVQSLSPNPDSVIFRMRALLFLPYSPIHLQIEEFCNAGLTMEAAYPTPLVCAVAMSA